MFDMFKLPMDTLGTVRAWAQHVKRCCANALDFVEPHMDDRETKEMSTVLSEKFDQFQIWLNKTQHRSTPLNRVFKCAQLVDLNMLRACTVDKSSAFARG